jgi:salicylate hydroxylase
LAAPLTLRQAGLDAHCDEQASVAPPSWDFRDWQSGDIIGRVPLADAAPLRWGAPFHNVHGADLHDVLRTAVGDQHLALGARCVSVEQHGSEVTIHVANGRHATGDLLIGADGIHSMVRECAAGPVEPTWWRQIP